MDVAIPDCRQRYEARDCRIYALGVGYGIDPSDPHQLDYVGPAARRVAPGLATAIGAPGFWLRNLDCGIDWRRVVHGEMALEILEPLPMSGDVTGRTRVTGIVDKGPGRAALVLAERELRDSATGALHAVIRDTFFLIGAGGFDGGGAGPARLPSVPDRAPDTCVALGTHMQLAFLHRLSGDRNEVHTDLAVARSVGYDRPILHGVATYGLACHALVRGLCDHDPERMRGLSCRFAAPVYPGQRIAVDIWRGADGQGAFQARIDGTGQVVLSHGTFQYAP
ncbi:hypothetical protein ATO6_20470 [Oceanicola sp. 22II-s10i]|nr:hypothetical protein ATO6_20470 [Oceanicola sp. 22II-s10i]